MAATNYLHWARQGREKVEKDSCYHPGMRALQASYYPGALREMAGLSIAPAHAVGMHAVPLIQMLRPNHRALHHHQSNISEATLLSRDK